MKINKHISFVLALLILVSNVGLAFNVHYCGGELAGISLDYKKAVASEVKKIEEEDSCCAAPKEENQKDSCCSNSKVNLKKSISDEVLVKSFQLDLSTFTFSNVWKPIAFTAVEQSEEKSDVPSFYCDSNAPPLYKLYCQYVFYERF